MRRYAVLFVLAGCHHATPTAELLRSNQNHLIGKPFLVSARWDASCTDWGGVFGNLMGKKDDPFSETKSCDGKPLALQVSCSSRCEIPGNAQGVGDATVTVVPLELGPLTITATNTRTDTGKAKQFTLPQLLIVLPDRLELQCAAGDQDYVLCGPDGVPAARPIIMPAVYVGNTFGTTSLLRINGKPHPHPDTNPISLAELYPEAALGTGIQPGTYPVTLEVESVVSRWQVVVR